jgi:glycine/D-amino acid oxidase-like deaminating enzyme
MVPAWIDHALAIGEPAMTHRPLDAALPDAPPALWLDTYGPYKPEPPLEGEQHVDVAIIGGGFTGIATAWELARLDPALDVAVLEARQVGYGASGRNGSFAMTVVGLGFGTMARLRGKAWVAAAHRYMMAAVDYLDEHITREALDCDRLRPGFLRVATSRAYEKRLQHEVALVQSLGFDDITWLDEAAVRARVDSPRYLGAMWEPRLVLVNPAKLVRANKRRVVEQGVRVYENTPALAIERPGRFRITTPSGTLTAEKLVFATNAYSDLFKSLRRRQTPAFTYMIATEPLSDAQLDALRWAGREGVEDARNLIHYYRLTPDHRVVLGGGPVGITWGGHLDADESPAAWRHLEEHLAWLFPALEGVRVTHRWGGPFSVTMDLTPALGALRDGRTFYSLGCVGHGVSMSHLNGRLLANLVLDRRDDLDPALPPCPFVNRRQLRWPVEPLRSALVRSLRAYLKLEDAWRDAH